MNHSNENSAVRLGDVAVTKVLATEQAVCSPNGPEHGSPVLEQFGEDADDEAKYPTGLKSFVILAALCLSLLTIAVDETIIATAIPKITDEFHSVKDIGWYGSSYFLTETALQPTFGRIYSAFGIKQTFIVSIIIFEIGSLVCATAPTSTALIVGRAIAGSGTGGIWSGSLLIVAYSFPLRKRPAAYGATSIIWTSATIGAPILGGILADKATWRWCFYINLPIGAVSIIICLIYLRIARDSNPNNMTLYERLCSLDLLGASLLIPSVICLLLALQWGGTTYPWSDARIIALLVLSVSLFACFVAIQRRLGPKGTTPPHMFKNATNSLAFIFAFLFGSAYFSLVYYLPVYFQAVQDVSPLQSALRLLPLLVMAILSSMGVGLVHSKLLKEKPDAKIPSSTLADRHSVCSRASTLQSVRALEAALPTSSPSQPPTAPEEATMINEAHFANASSSSSTKKAKNLPPISEANTTNYSPADVEPATRPKKQPNQIYNLTLLVSTTMLAVSIPLLTIFNITSPISLTMPILLLTGLSIGPLFTAGQMLVQSNLAYTPPSRAESPSSQFDRPQPKEIITESSNQPSAQPVQKSPEHPDLPIATALASFFQTLGGALGLSISALIFRLGLATGLKEHTTGVDIDMLLQGGGTGIRKMLEGLGKGEQTEGVLRAWMLGLRDVWWYCGGSMWGALVAVIAILIVAVQARKHVPAPSINESFVKRLMTRRRREKETGSDRIMGIDGLKEYDQEKMQGDGGKNRSEITLVECPS